MPARQQYSKFEVRIPSRRFPPKIRRTDEALPTPGPQPVSRIAARLQHTAASRVREREGNGASPGRNPDANWGTMMMKMSTMERRDLRRIGMMFAAAGVVSLLNPLAATAQDRAPGERVIRVTGIGEVEVRPDEATIAFAVETFGETASAAAQQNAQQMERVIAALVSAGIPRDELETQGYNLHPEYVHDPEAREARIRGYRATNQVTLTTTNLDRVGPLIDVALQAGANRLDGINFSVRDTQAAMGEAIARAVENARESAEALAGALGVRLGPVVDATTSSSSTRPPVPLMARAAMGGDMEMASTPIQPGDQTVRATVAVSFAIAG